MKNESMSHLFCGQQKQTKFEAKYVDHLLLFWLSNLVDWIQAFKRAAESLEKLLDVTREELPDTMAAVRLSGMEISDLTMELSDLGLAFFFPINLCLDTLLFG